MVPPGGSGSGGGGQEGGSGIDKDMAWHLRKEWRYRERGWLRFLQIWFTDILGAIVPGVCFVAVFVLWLFAIAVLLGISFGDDVADYVRAFLFSVEAKEGSEGVGGPTFIGYVIVLTGTYICGYIFYRQTPKLPGSMGFWRNFLRFSPIEGCCWVDKPRLKNARGAAPPAHPTPRLREYFQDSLRCFFGCERDGCSLPCREWLVLKAASSDGRRFHWRNWLCWPVWEVLYLFRKPPRCWRVEFPFRGLRRYLIARRMLHLAYLVPWGQEPGGPGVSGSYPTADDLNRSKHFINKNKEWIHCELSSEYATVARNESHVRMVSSVWYVTRTLLRLFLVYAVLSVVWLLLGRAEWHHAVLALVGILVLGWFKARIEEFVHYQRVREIVSILCMAEFMNQELGKGVYGKDKASRLKKKAIADAFEAEAKALVDCITKAGGTQIPAWLDDLSKGTMPPWLI